MFVSRITRKIMGGLSRDLEIRNIHRVRKNGATLFLPLTLPNIGQVSTVNF